MRLKDKVAVITGGTAGIGLAIAQRFSEEGAKLVLIGSSPERGAAALEVLPGARFLAVDVSDKKAVDEAFASIFAEQGSVDILVNNAGIALDGLLMKMSEEQWDRVLDVNLKSAYNTCHAVIRPMMKSRSGKILNMTSVVALTGNEGQTNYSASKAGLIGFTKSLAREVASRQICVNCIAPGYIKTQMTDAIPEKYREMILAKIPFGRQGEPEEIAEAALFLVSDSSNYITGQVLTVDGGMVM